MTSRQTYHTGTCMKELSLTFKLLVSEQIPQENHTGDCLKEISLTFNFILMQQITGEIG